MNSVERSREIKSDSMRKSLFANFSFSLLTILCVSFYYEKRENAHIVMAMINALYCLQKKRKLNRRYYLNRRLLLDDNGDDGH